MILHCNTRMHPLRHSGTQQRERLIKALIPENLLLDGRSMEQLLAFAAQLAGHVRYFNADNQEAGDWTTFWESDTTSLLAILASTDLEIPKTTYRSKELEYYRIKRKEDRGLQKEGDPGSSTIIDELVTDPIFGIYSLAMSIARICEKAPEHHSIKKEVAAIIESRLQQPVRRLIQFHKAVDPMAIDKYKRFIGDSVCAKPWGLPDIYAVECIDFLLPYEYVEELWKLFLAFFKVLSLIIEKSKRAFQSAIRSRKDHQPHICLFISFLQLFRYLQQEMNNVTGRHLIYYYKDILRLQQARLIPDKVHVVFEIAQNVQRHRLSKGLLLKGGMDSSGKLIQYVLEEELVAGKAKLLEKRNLYVTENTEPGEAGKTTIDAISLPAADKRDGVEEEFAEGAKAWHALSGIAVIDRFNYKLKKAKAFRQKFNQEEKPVPQALQKEIQSVEMKMAKLQAVSGFTISSPELMLNKSKLRIIWLTIDFTTPLLSNLLDTYTVHLSTNKGPIPLRPYPIEITDPSADDLKEFTAPFFAKRELNADSCVYDPLYCAENLIVKVANEQTYIIILHTNFPHVIPLADGSPPFVRFGTKGKQDLLPSINRFRLKSFSSFSAGAKITPGDISITLHRLSNGSAESGVQLVIGAGNSQEIFIRIPELFKKDVEFMSIFDPGGFDEGVFNLLKEHSWQLITDGGGAINGVYTEKDIFLTAPESFNFSGVAQNPDGWIQFTFDGPEKPFVLQASSFSFEYETRTVQIPVSDFVHRKKNLHTVRYFTSQGEWVLSSSDITGFRPTPLTLQPQASMVLTADLFKEQELPLIANGNLFLGFENLQPSQNLSLLFKTVPGTGNPDHFAPDIVWSYLKDNDWIAFPPQYILKDETLGMQQTGIILFQMPADINNGNTWIKGKEDRTDLYWIRASATELPTDDVFVDALPMLTDVHVNAVTAVFNNADNSTDHLSDGLPQGSVSSLRFRDVNIKTVSQPYSSFGGRLPEEGDRFRYYQRISERLRHKHRAVTIWDYERIVLERFPNVAVVKCLSHTRRYDVVRPGYVTIAAIPYPSKMIGSRKFYPNLDAGDLQSIHDHLIRVNSYFVGGYGDPTFCCCEDGCECESAISRLTVINARFEPVRIKLCVRFYKGKDIPFYTKQLNEALKSFLAPWAKDGKQILFGVSIRLTTLLQFLEKLDYVDVIVNLQVKHFISRRTSDEEEENVEWSSMEEILPFTSASVLTTYLDRLNEDNPNVIDHEINVIHEHDHCECATCSEEAPTVVPVPDPRPFAPELIPTAEQNIQQVSTNLEPSENRNIPDNAVKQELTHEEVTKESNDDLPKSEVISTGSVKDFPVTEKVLPSDAAINTAQSEQVNMAKEMLAELWSKETNTTKVIIAFTKRLDEAVDKGLLFGEKTSDPGKADESIHAYRIEKEKAQAGNRISQLKVGLKVLAGEPFQNFEVTNPHL